MRRYVSVRTPHESLETRLVWKGLPQGSVLSPILYNIYTSSIEYSLNNDCYILQYADDLALYVTNDSIPDAATSLNTSLISMNNFLVEHGLDLSPPKSAIMIFSRKRQIPEINIKLNDQTVPIRNKVKFLGVYLDPKLTGIYHAEYLARRCERAIPILKALAGVWWGSHPFCLRLVYNALIRSILDYGSYLFPPCSKMAFDKLDKIQLSCLRIVIGCMKSSPSNAVQVESCDPPLALRRQYLCDRFISKVFTSSAHPLRTRLEALQRWTCPPRSPYWVNKEPPLLIKSFNLFKHTKNSELNERLPCFKYSLDISLFKPISHFDINIFKNSPGANARFNAEVDKRWKDWNQFYTDASKLSLQHETGVAVFCSNLNIILQYKCPPESSVFTGESVGILEASKFILANNLKKNVIFSDSLSSIKALDETFKTDKHHIIMETKDTLYKCALSDIIVHLVWVPSHVGIRGNEMVDELAKQASQKDTHADMTHYKTPRNDLTSLVKTNLIKKWNDTWKISSLKKGTRYAGAQPTVQHKPWFNDFKKAKRSSITTLCRIRLGHCCTPQFLNKIRIRDNSLCECGIDEGSLDHIFFECSSYNSKNINLYRILPNLKIPLPINFQSLLTYSSQELNNTLIHFIQLNNIKL